MSRVLITGSAPVLPPVVDALHRVRTLHITDYTEQYDGFKIGRPLEGAEARSGKLLMLRAASKTLGIEGASPAGEPHTAGWASERLDQLLSLLEEEVGARQKQRQQEEAALHDLEKRVEAAILFAGLPLTFEAYMPYESLAVYTGTVKSPIADELAGSGGRYEIFQDRPDGLLALFVEKRLKDAVEKLLARHGFTEVRPPPETGRPAAFLEKMEAQMAQKRSRIALLGEEMDLARHKYQDDILACAEQLGIEIEKVEAPLRFASTRSCFVIEGWVPTEELDATKNALIKATGDRVHMERIEEKEWLEEEGRLRKAAGTADDAPAEGTGADKVKNGRAVPAKGTASAKEDGGQDDDDYESVPIALSNPGPVKPFEALTEMFSLPDYREIDPTVLLALVFPFFFGLMIGDAGYGVLLVITGIVFRAKLKKWEGLPQIGWYIIVAGFIATIFGLFVFGEAFGLPFHAPAGEAEAMDWYGLSGVDIPLKGSVHKLEGSGLGTLMVLSVLAGVVHLILGNLLGAVNKWGHSKRHSVGKLGWVLVVLGFGLILFKFGDKTSIGAWLMSGPWGLASSSWDPGIGILIPYTSVVFLAIGVSMALAGEGGMALLEVPGMFAHLLSYTRLAAIGVAKAALAFSFNIILIPLVISGNVVYIVGGWALLIAAHFLVFVLGGLSSGIQALRLNLVEFFMKFYKGGGIKFNPFGHVRKYTVDN
jgi:V/A-type H+-transporting ATPase subunit I